jgi:S-adenosylmethionine:tRNA ribosyltransferase-isomerase
MAVDRCSGAVGHHVFRQLPSLLRAGDTLVVNDSRVLPARVHMVKSTGGKAELLFLRPLPALSGSASKVGCGERWEVLARPSQRLREGMSLRVEVENQAFADSPATSEVLLEERLGEGTWVVCLPADVPALTFMERFGEMPLPPYIKAALRARQEYQTVYAAAPGSAAAPTAGLHFTPRLLRDLRETGIETATVTLHVGLDTFRPIAETTVEKHRIHTELYTVNSAAVARMDLARREGRRLVAVGTTTVRVLETLYRTSDPAGPALAPLAAGTDIFITPGFRFQAVDALITNFHLPRTSLLALVMAYAGPSLVRSAYAEAVKERYRLFSFGDAMLIHGSCG